jgi:hypothetical protein
MEGPAIWIRCVGDGGWLNNMAKRRGGGRTISIRFKDNKVSKVSGARSLSEAGEAALFGQMFVDQLTGPERVETVERAREMARGRGEGGTSPTPDLPAPPPRED